MMGQQVEVDSKLKTLSVVGVEKSRSKLIFSYLLQTRKQVIDSWPSWSSCTKEWRTAPVGVAKLWDELRVGMKG